MQTNSVNLNAPPPPVNPAPVITLTTDFGLADPFVGTMKGVILGRCPGARVIDLTHQIPPQDVLAARLALEATHPYFPVGTLHVAVVDPGVGTDRAVLWVRTASAGFLAPDNGLLSFLEAGEILELRRVDNPERMLHPVSRTFHGRDVFAPAAGDLAGGISPGELGPEVDEMVRVDLPRPAGTGDQVEGEVLGFDHFGNAVTNLREPDLPPGASLVDVAGRAVPFAPTYAAVPRDTPLALLGSSGRVEIAVRDGSARRTLGLRRGDRVRVRIS